MIFESIPPPFELYLRKDGRRRSVAVNETRSPEPLPKTYVRHIIIGRYQGAKVAIKQLLFVDDENMRKYIEREMSLLMYAFLYASSSVPPSPRFYQFTLNTDYGK